MPKKAVGIYFLLAILGAAIFVYFTFPRTKEEIPQSNNQRPYPSSPGPNGVPAPETVPHPAAPTPPKGPTLRVMAWATADEVASLQAQADAFEAQTGARAALVIDGDEADYRRDLHDAFVSGQAPDVCLVASRDFSGLEPSRQLAVAAAPFGISSRATDAFTTQGQLRAVPDEFSVDMLFYNEQAFDRAGIAYPGPHWTWDIMESMTRALASLRQKTDAGDPIYPLELPADFDFWNILCTQAGHPALDRDHWHLADSESRDSQVRGLDLIHEFFRDLSVTAPADKIGATPGRYFLRQQAALLIAPSELQASLPNFRHGLTVLPSDLGRASLARVNGWAEASASVHPREAAALAAFFSAKPLHVGWSSVRPPIEGSDEAGLCYQALEQSLLPRLVPKTARLARLLDAQINSFATDPTDISSEKLYAQIQAEYLSSYAPQVSAKPANLNKTDGLELRGL